MFFSRFNNALALALERLGLSFPVLLQENFDLAFRFFQFLSARSGKLHSFLEKRQRLFQRHFALFEFLNDLLKSLNAIFKLWQVREISLISKVYTVEP